MPDLWTRNEKEFTLRVDFFARYLTVCLILTYGYHAISSEAEHRRTDYSLNK